MSTNSGHGPDGTGPRRRDVGAPPQAQMPDFFDWVRDVRRHRGLTQEQAAQRAKISLSYLRTIENQRFSPDRTVVHCISNAYQLDDMQQRHLLELWAPAVDLAHLDALRTRLITSGELDVLDYHERTGVRAIFIDHIWDVLAANPSALHTFPGLHQGGGNVLSWYFSPAAQEVVVEWNREAPHIVATARAVLGRHRKSPRATQLLERLRQNPDFNQHWENTMAVAYSRPPGVLLHWREPTTGEPFSMSVQTSDHFGAADIFLSCGFPREYSGPPIS
ncbi:helix-turn-helix domain-containing protein [Nocardia sp. CA-107356]|uniref:helix-turn-helix domain-containing protein n=1 Tax=Nocardia sp. CA-107356 TaxID=3239972 RepID=UPI003D8AB190